MMITQKTTRMTMEMIMMMEMMMEMTMEMTMGMTMEMIREMIKEMIMEIKKGIAKLAEEIIIGKRDKNKEKRMKVELLWQIHKDHCKLRLAVLMLRLQANLAIPDMYRNVTSQLPLGKRDGVHIPTPPTGEVHGLAGR